MKSDSANTLYENTGEEILKHRAAITEAVLSRQSTYVSGQRIIVGGAAYDAEAGLAYLAEALTTDRPTLFVDYLRQTAVTLGHRGVHRTNLLVSLDRMVEAIMNILPVELSRRAITTIEQGRRSLEDIPHHLPCFIQPGHPHSLLATEYLRLLLKQQRQSASRLIQDAVDHGISIQDIYLHVFQQSQYEVGRLWQMNEIDLAHEHYCSAATHLVMSQLYPYIFSGNKTEGTFIGACAVGDLHELGGRMIADFFEMAGWQTFYLGANASDESVIQAVVEHKASVLGISVTMTPHVRAARELVRKVRAERACTGVTILVGGYPFAVEPHLWRTVDADGWAQDARSVVDLATRLFNQGAA